MIIEGLCVVVFELVKFIFGWINLPAFPEEAQVAIDTYMSYVFDNLNCINFFVNVSTLKTIALVAISVLLFKQIYKVIIWIIHKIPLSVD